MKSKTLISNQEYALTWSLQPAEGQETIELEDRVWLSSDDSVCQVIDAGPFKILRAMAPGKCTISCKAAIKSGGSVRADLAVAVVNPCPFNIVVGVGGIQN